MSKIEIVVIGDSGLIPAIVVKAKGYPEVSVRYANQVADCIDIIESGAKVDLVIADPNPYLFKRTGIESAEGRKEFLKSVRSEHSIKVALLSTLRYGLIEESGYIKEEHYDLDLGSEVLVSVVFEKVKELFN